MLVQDSAYGVHLYQRWTSLRTGILQEQKVHFLIDSLVTQMGDAVNRNFQKWPVLGIYVWPNLYVGGTYPVSYTHLDVYKRQLYNSGRG